MHEHEYRDEYITDSVVVQFGSSFKSGCCLRIPLQPQQHAAIQAVEPASMIYLYYSTKMNTTQAGFIETIWYELKVLMTS